MFNTVRLLSTANCYIFASSGISHFNLEIKMTKSLKLVLTSVLVASTAAAGNAVAAANNSFDGFYAGAGISRDSAKFNYKVVSPIDSTNNYRQRNDAGSNGFSGAVFAGYGMSFGQFYLGAEVDAAANSVKSKDSFSADTPMGPIQNIAEYEMKSSYGISILPGFNVTDKVMIYGRLGYVNSKFEAKFTATDPSFNPVSKNDSKSLGGIRYGLGIATALMPNLNLRLDYTHADYSTHRTTLDNPFYRNNSFKPTTDQVQLGISYRFA